MMDDDSSLSYRSLSIESVDSETKQQMGYNRCSIQVSQIDSENRFISEICESLLLEIIEPESRMIAKQLLINGRQELVHHRDSIALMDFDKQMDKKENSRLLEILKRYFEQQWEQIQLNWFKTFITKQQSQNDNRHYQQVLTRTAEYGRKYMKECSVFSIVFQLVFIFNDDINVDESKFDQVWNTFAMEGYKIALKKWERYMIPGIMKDHIDSRNSPLFLALREYFREPVLTLFEESNISNRQNLLEIALDCLADAGWAVHLNNAKVKALLSPVEYTLLMNNLKKYIRENGLTLPVVNFSTDSSNSHDNFQSSMNDSILAYIPELPLKIVDNHLLEDMIRQCLQSKHKQEVVRIKCDTHLGIGMVYLSSYIQRDHLINVIKSIILDAADKQDMIIKFVLIPELISYVVIDLPNKGPLPSSNEIAQQWKELNSFRGSVPCEQLSIQFPNVFRIVSNSVDEFIKAMTRKTFSINGLNATVYFRADCCFLEELSHTTNTHQIRNAVVAQLAQENIAPDSIYIQYNETSANAIILTCLKIQRWTLSDSIKLNGRKIPKKNSLPYRLLLRPIPKGLSISQIGNHSMFQHAVKEVSMKDEHAIVELSNKAAYEQCVKQGALRIGQQLLHAEICTFTKNFKESEINARNWYETDISNHKPDIMPFVRNPQHPIFQWKWNPQGFQEQFQRFNTNQHDHFDRDSNQKRRFLRVTVMLNTIGTVWKGSYFVAQREIKIREDLLKTIVYDHRSKLQHGTTTRLFKANTVPYTSTLIKVVDKDCLYVYQQLVAHKYWPVLLNMAHADSPGGGYRRGDSDQEETLFCRSNYFRSLDSDIDNGKSTCRVYCDSDCELETLSERQRMYPMDEFQAIYTSGLTVFRRAEDTGYAFMDEPLSDVCAIAMAAYKNPTVENDRLAQKFVIGMRKKIETIFAIAYHHKHDCLVLSALGCGAFRNPPKHVATIFKSVAEQYAGFFKRIYFTVKDDYSTGLQFNLEENYSVFRQVLDGLELRPEKHKIEGMMIGPRRILNMPNSERVTLSDIRISQPCYHGEKCNYIQNIQHCRKYSHPSICPFMCSGTTCKFTNDEDHMLLFIHPPKCPYGSECPLVRGDVKHANLFEHPKYNPIQLTNFGVFFNCKLLLSK